MKLIHLLSFVFQKKFLPKSRTLPSDRWYVKNSSTDFLIQGRKDKADREF